MKSCMEIILTRRSVKKYKSDMPKREDIDKIIEAGLAAASGRNLQASVIVAVTNKEIRDRLSRDNAAVMGAGADPFYGAPCVIVVLADPAFPTWIDDGSLVMGNLLNAAHALGLGSCWIHRAKQVFDSPEGKALLRAWGVPEHLRGVGNCILGYPACDHPAPAPRKEGRLFRID